MYICYQWIVQKIPLIICQLNFVLKPDLNLPKGFIVISPLTDKDGASTTNPKIRVIAFRQNLFFTFWQVIQPLKTKKDEYFLKYRSSF